MIERLHPFTIFYYFCLVIGLSMTGLHPCLLLLSMGCAIWLFLLWSTDRASSSASLWKEFLGYAILFLAVTIANPLFSHNGATVLFYLNGQRITLEAVIYGACGAGMLLSIFLWCRSLSHYMTADRVMYLFGRISKKGALILSMVLHFVPEYRSQAGKMRANAKQLGLIKEGTLLQRIRLEGQIFSGMITWALEHSLETADSMSARGYGSGPLSSYSKWQIRKVDVCLWVVWTMLLAAFVIFKICGGLQIVFYPTVIAWNHYIFTALQCLIFSVIAASLPVYNLRH